MRFLDLNLWQLVVVFLLAQCWFLLQQLNFRLLDSSLVLYESYIWILNNRDFLKLKSENSFLSFWQQNYSENIFLTIFLAQRVSKSRIYPKNAVKQKVNSDEFMDFFGVLQNCDFLRFPISGKFGTKKLP